MRKCNVMGLAFKLIVDLLVAIAPAAAGPINVQFVGVGGQNQNGYYTYPYFISMNSGPGTAMICDDFYDDISVGDMWQAHMTELSSGDVSKSMFGDLQKYEEAAFLLFHIASNDQDQWGNINWAIWKIFDPDVDVGPGNEDAVNYWLTLAKTTDLSRIDFSGVRILTPDQPGYQEFLYNSPEPGTLLLVGSGLIGLWIQSRHQA
jgi:PEP-CTERM motif